VQRRELGSRRKGRRPKLLAVSVLLGFDPGDVGTM
jgi:hypothetical protein